MFKLEEVFNKKGDFKKKELTKKILEMKAIESEAKQEGWVKNKYMRNLINGNYFLPNKENLKIFHEAYIGDPLYLQRKDAFKKDYVECDAFDIHSAYGYGFKTKMFPLSCELTDKPTPLSIHYIKISGWSVKKEFAPFEFDIYKQQLNNGEFYITNVGLRALKKMYNIDIKVEEIAYFKYVDYMPNKFKEYLDYCYAEKEKIKLEGDDYKYAVHKVSFNSAQYGYFGRKFKKRCRQDKHIVTAEELDKTNEPTVVIAMFQTDYVKDLMTDVILKYIDDVVYVNTDGIVLKAGSKFKQQENIGDDLGQFGIEYENKKVTFYRYSVYIVWDDIKKHIMNKNSRFGALNIEPNEKQLKDILAHKTVIPFQNVKLDDNDKAILYDVKLTTNHGWEGLEEGILTW